MPAAPLLKTESGVPSAHASVTGRTWRLRDGGLEPEARNRMAAALAQRCGVPIVIAELMAARGIGLDEAAGFLDPKLRDQMPDPHVLQDMEAAAARVADAVAGHEKIAIFGDYDVDGATSSALLYRYLTAAGGNVTVYIPDRLSEGYGPNAAALTALMEGGASLVVTVDCGATAFEPLDHARALGLGVIVVDHHKSEARLPAADAVVNPNRLDDTSGLGHMAAVGLAFMLAVAVNRTLRTRGHFATTREPDLIALLDLVAVGTVCDVVPLTGINRALVSQGLKVLAGRGNPGFAALADVARLDEAPGAYHAGFVIGPRINAGGRVGTAGLGAELLRTDAADRTAELASILNRLNAERQALEAAALEQALARCESAAEADARLLFVADPAWHAGIVGIVAARLKDRFHRPAFVGNQDGDVIKASGRSVSGVDMGAIVIAARQAGLVEGGGGHAMAAGLTLHADRADDFRAFAEERIADQLGNTPLAPRVDYDARLAVGGATLDLATELERLGPFGAGNPTPKFMLSNAMVADARPMGRDQTHLRCRLSGHDGRTLDVVAFRALPGPIGTTLMERIGATVDVVGKLERNRWQGRERVRFTIEDVAIPAVGG